MSIDYDAKEARDLLGRASGQFNRNKIVREATTNACLQAFEKLVKEVDPTGTVLYARRTSSSVVEFGRVLTDEAVFIAPRDYGFLLKHEAGHERKVNLEFNAVTELLEGAEDDRYLAPTPGQPVPRRAALAVLVEAAIEFVSGREFEADMG